MDVRMDVRMDGRVDASTSTRDAEGHSAARALKFYRSPQNNVLVSPVRFQSMRRGWELQIAKRCQNPLYLRLKVAVKIECRIKEIWR